MTAHIQQWIAYAMKMECRGCGDRLFSDEAEARDAVEAVIEEGHTEPPELREYYSYCGGCDHFLSKGDLN